MLQILDWFERMTQAEFVDTDTFNQTCLGLGYWHSLLCY